MPLGPDRCNGPTGYTVDSIIPPSPLRQDEGLTVLIMQILLQHWLIVAQHFGMFFLVNNSSILGYIK
jgi:hypothetical protein